jgi:hypothetical protein
MEWSRWGEWSVVVGLLLALLYTMRVIRREKGVYLKTAVPVTIGPFVLLTPSWWQQQEDENKTGTSFHRGDTRYDWRAHFDFQAGKQKQSLEEQMLKLIKSEELLFDQDSTIIHTPSHFETHPLVQKGLAHVIRIEGTATQRQIERVYFDAYIVSLASGEGRLVAKSRSSILNGIVEGPYFEEVLNRFELLEKKEF